MDLTSYSAQLRQLAKNGPFFLYDGDALATHAASLSQSHSGLWYACKANPLKALLQILHQARFRFDVASEGELQQVLNCGIKGEDILVTGPSKPEKLLKLALENKVKTFVIESPNQLQQLESLAVHYGYKPSVLLRLQLRWDEEETKNLGGQLGGHKITPFGMDVKTAQALIGATSLPVKGFHVFQWGNILSAKNLGRVWKKIASTCKNLNPAFETLDVGGGLGIPYHQEKPLIWEEVIQQIHELQKEFHIPQFWLELGRYVTGPCGYYVTQVVDRKQTYGQDLIILEGGSHHIARPALTGEAFPVQALKPNSAAAQIPFNLHGPLCTALDFLGTHLLPADIGPGDVLIFSQAGAYGFTESMPFFLGHQLPAEILLQHGKLTVIREAQPATWWMK